MYDATRSVAEFLDATAAKQPVPGGGAVSALVGALGCALGEMVLNYSIGKKGLEAYAGELKPALAELHKARELLTQLMVEDQAAYQAYTDARKLAADNPDRQGKLDAALLASVRVPQAMAAAGVAILQRVDKVVSFVNIYLLSDFQICTDLTMAMIRCAIYNVRVNLPQFTDAEDRRSIESTVGQILNHALTLMQSIVPRLHDRMEQGA